MDYLINDLLQRAETCDALTPRAIPGDALRMEDVGRLKGKAEAYRHAAEIAREALEMGAMENARLRAEVDALKAAQSSARREGAEAMREACVAEVDAADRAASPEVPLRVYRDLRGRMYALPLPE